MKRIVCLCICVCLALGLTACKKDEPQKFTVSQVVHSIEVNETYDALSFIRDTSAVGYQISVTDNSIDPAKLGTYSVTFHVVDPKSEKSTDVTYSIRVEDTTAPELTVDSSITLEKDSVFLITDYASAEDNYDGDISERIELDCDIDTSEPGVYSAIVFVRDSSGNKTSQSVGIYIIGDDEDEEPEVSDSTLEGTYMVDYDSDARFNPTLVLSSKMTFSLTINYCVGMQSFSGSYSVNGSTLTLTTDDFPFDEEDPSSTTLTMTINDDGTLTYTNNYGACSPVRHDVFEKVNP